MSHPRPTQATVLIAHTHTAKRMNAGVDRQAVVGCWIWWTFVVM
jgi:hypothetical protein